MTEEEAVEQRRQARKEMAHAAGLYADTIEFMAGGLVTGYVAVFEVSMGNGEQHAYWLTGTGGEPDDVHSEGLAVHRLEGLVRHVLRSLDCGNTLSE